MADQTRKRQHQGGHGAQSGGNQHQHQHQHKKHKSDPSRAKYRHQAAYLSSGLGGGGGGSHTSSQAKESRSIQAGDVGLFVTCDKGKERSAVREVLDLLEERFFGGHEGEVGERVERDGGRNEGKETEGGGKGNGDGGRAGEEEARNEVVGTSRSIEDDIAAELEELKALSSATTTTTPSTDPLNGSTHNTQQHSNSTGNVFSPLSIKLTAISLDIPCVSFIRFPPLTSISTSTSSHQPPNPTDIILSILRDAANPTSKQKSRFIKRLTPMTKVRKVLNGGLDAVCSEVLPVHFGLDAGAEGEGVNSVEDAAGVRNETEEAKGNSSNGYGDGDGDVKKEEESAAQAESQCEPAPAENAVLELDAASRTGTSATSAPASTPVPDPTSSPDRTTTALKPCKFRIEVSRRESTTLTRDTIIQTVASHIQRLGHNRHKVDLKCWDKLILVEVYRGIVGMSVIDIGHEEWVRTLKNGNLAEVYTSTRLKIQEEMEGEAKAEEESLLKIG